jgi:hypothetical protein
LKLDGIGKIKQKYSGRFGFFGGMGYCFAARTMKPQQKKIAISVFFAATLLSIAARGQSLDQIGVTLLRAVTTNVNGAGIRVAQPEAALDSPSSFTIFEVNPATVGQPTNLFTYISSGGSSSNYPNSVGTESGHADAVGGYFYGISGGVATNVAHVDNYEADYFYDDIIAAASSPNINDPVVSQSFSFGVQPTNTQEQIDSAYDNYSTQYKTLFISAVNNGGSVCAPGTSYNCIGVGAYGGGSSTGPTLDNGRAKPDITAPGSETSYSTPQVAGAAAVLMQAGLRGDGGSDTNSAVDIRTVKALLLNGAVKPADWTNSNSSPLDARYGAGVLNVFNSYEQLAGGKHAFTVSTTVSSGGVHPPNGATGAIAVLSGWDFNTNTSSFLNDAVNHYYFNATNDLGDAKLTATLVWNRQQNQSAINNLNLFLYNAANSNLVACSTSLVDNVEHVFVPQLPPGRYDLQVWKAGGLGIVSDSEPYALAWAFISPPTVPAALNIAKSGTNIALTWPILPTGFVVESATNLISPVVWNTNQFSAPIYTNSQNYLLLDPTNAAQFFRLFWTSP